MVDTQFLDYATDATSDVGVDRLARRIRDYWKARGYEVHVKCERAAFSYKMRSARLEIHSDMVNGLPPLAWAEKRSRAA